MRIFTLTKDRPEEFVCRMITTDRTSDWGYGEREILFPCTLYRRRMGTQE